MGTSGTNPLLHYMLHGRAEGRVAAPYDAGEALEAAVRARHQGLAGPAAALFTGVRADHIHIPLQAAAQRRRSKPYRYHRCGSPSGSVR